MLFWKQRLRHATKQREKYLALTRTFINPAAPECEPVWKKFHKYDRWIFNFEQKGWEKQIIHDIKASRPYGAFYWIPQLMIGIVQRCYEYWNDGYNVRAAEEWAAPIREQVNHAWELAQRCLNYDGYCIQDEFPKDQVIELFTYVAQHFQEWSD